MLASSVREREVLWLEVYDAGVVCAMGDVVLFSLMKNAYVDT